MDAHILGRYAIKSELGRGGMATVYLAHDSRFRRDVAIKVLPREFLHDPAFRARFEREAQTIASLEHAAIVPVYDFGTDGDDGQPFLVMRYMPGGSLADRLQHSALSLSQSLAILRRLAGALDRAHARGVIHRDLKPGNVLFDHEGEAYLSDFGMVKLMQETSSFTGSAVVGTPAYMSPEQARGESDIDGRSDVYALGAVLFQMLSGQQPYDADTPMGIVVKHIVDPVPRIRDVNADLPPACEAVISRALTKDRNERYRTSGELARALEAISSGDWTHPLLDPITPPRSAITAAPEAQAAAPTRPDRRLRLPGPAWAGLTGAAVVIVLTLIYNLLAGPAAASAATSATLSELINRVNARPDTASGFQPAHEGQRLGPGSEVQTLAESAARLDFANGSVVRMGENSAFTLARVEDEEAGLAIRFQFEFGRLRIDLTAGTIEAETPVGTAAVRGSYATFIYQPGAQAGTADDVLILDCFEGTCRFENETTTEYIGNLTRLTVTAGGQSLARTPLDELALAEFLDGNPEGGPVVPTLTEAARLTGSPTGTATAAPSDAPTHTATVTASPSPTLTSTGVQPSPSPQGPGSNTPTASPTASATRVRRPTSFVTPTPAVIIATEVFPVYDCIHLGNNVFEWYEGTVTYENGTPVAVTHTAGPFTGIWQPGCPAGEPARPPDSNPCPSANASFSKVHARLNARLVRVLPPTDPPPPPPPPPPPDC